MKNQKIPPSNQYVRPEVGLVVSTIVFCFPVWMKAILIVWLSALLIIQTGAQELIVPMPPPPPFTRSPVVVTQYTVIHNFVGAPSDGSNPNLSSLCFPTYNFPYFGQYSFGRLYGTTIGGAAGLVGTVYEINTDGSGYQILSDFGIFDGYPFGGDPQRNYLASIIFPSYGGTPAVELFGTTIGGGGPCNSGTIFSLLNNGTTVQLGNLHSFCYGDEDDGVGNGLVRVGNTLYGTSMGYDGVVFKTDINGNFTQLHHFEGSPNDGQQPQTTLTDGGIELDAQMCCPQPIDGAQCMCVHIVTNHIFYGTTLYGGINDQGTLFRIKMSGDNSTLIDYKVLYSFDEMSPDGTWTKWPAFAPLTLVGNKLYGGTTRIPPGGIPQVVIFSINTDGSGYSVLKTIPITGGTPTPLMAIGNTLYGTIMENSYLGSPSLVFTISLDGSNFQVLHQFGGNVRTTAGSLCPDGMKPDGRLTLVRGHGADPTLTYDVLYGTTEAGGSNNMGTVFGLPVHVYTNAIINTNLPIPMVPNMGGGQYAGGTFSFNLSGAPETSWTLCWSTNLADWTGLTTLTFDDSGIASFRDGTAGTTSCRFYKLTDGTNCSRIIGFEQITVEPGSTATIANQLEAPTNTLDGLFNPAMPDGTTLPAGTVIQKWTALQSWLNYTWDGNQWSPDGNATLNPGEGAKLQNISGSPLTITFVGLVPEGQLSIPLSVNGYNFVSSMMPQTGGIQSELGYNPGEFDSIMQWKNGDWVAFFYDPTVDPPAWEDSNFNPISEPVINVGESFFIIPAGPTTWTRDFLPCSGIVDRNPPAITVQPQSQAVNAGDAVAFTVETSDSINLHYQWQFNGADIPGANDSTYVITAVAARDAGNYAVTVSNPWGSTNSMVATLSVASLPYVVLNSLQTDYIFTGGQTYYVTGIVPLSGTTTLQGGAVVKFAPGAGLVVDALDCQTSPGNPAIFTSRNDDTIGLILPDSTHAPAKGDYATALEIDNNAATAVHDVQITYAGGALDFQNTGTSGSVTNIVENATIRHCGGPAINSNLASLALGDSMIGDIGPNSSGYALDGYFWGGLVNNAAISSCLLCYDSGYGDYVLYFSSSTFNGVGGTDVNTLDSIIIDGYGNGFRGTTPFGSGWYSF